MFDVCTFDDSDMRHCEYSRTPDLLAIFDSLALYGKVLLRNFVSYSPATNGIYTERNDKVAFEFTHGILTLMFSGGRGRLHSNGDVSQLPKSTCWFRRDQQNINTFANHYRFRLPYSGRLLDFTRGLHHGSVLDEKMVRDLDHNANYHEGYHLVLIWCLNIHGAVQITTTDDQKCSFPDNIVTRDTIVRVFDAMSPPPPF